MNTVFFDNVEQDLLEALGSILLASGSQVSVTDGTQALIREGDGVSLVEAEAVAGPAVRVQDLSALFRRVGLDPGQAADRAVFWGFRNVLLRVEQGESWAPQMLRKILRKEYAAVGTPTPHEGKSHLLVTAGPERLLVQSIQALPEKTLQIRLDREAFKQLLAGNPGRKEWREWIRSDAVQFSQEPLWLKLVLKLL